jgi:hypothetical protein
MAPARTFNCVDCGKTAHGYDHRDYRKPLDVVPICRSCNYKRGPALFCGAYMAKESKSKRKKRLNKTGRLGGLKGGPARAAALSPERRKEIATMAARARWPKPA